MGVQFKTNELSVKVPLTACNKNMVQNLTLGLPDCYPLSLQVCSEYLAATYPMVLGE